MPESLRHWFRALLRPYPLPLRWAALLFFALGLLVQWWRLASFTASFDQALFYQLLWSTWHGHPFESTLSSELSAAVTVHDLPPQLGYLHIAQHSNVLTLLAAPLLPLLGLWTLPLLQVVLLTAAGLVLFRMAQDTLPEPLAVRLAVAYFAAGTVIGPLVENYHDLCAIPLLGFLLIRSLLKHRWGTTLLWLVLLCLVRQDAGITAFSIGLWALVRCPGSRRQGLVVMGYSVASVALLTAVVQPQFGADLSDRFMQEKFAPFMVGRDGGGTLALLLSMLQQPGLLLQELLSPPGRTLTFLLAIALPLALIPLRSVDVGLLIAAPLFVPLASQGMSALSVTLRYVMFLVPALFAGTMLWWREHLPLFERRGFRPYWTAALALSLVLTLTSNPYRSFSALIPDSFDPWVHVSVPGMLRRAATARQMVDQVPPLASVAADTPLLPRLAGREVALRYPRNDTYRDRDGQVRPVDWIAAFPAYYHPYRRVFKTERGVERALRERTREHLSSGRYGVVACRDGAFVLRRQAPSKPALAGCIDSALADP